MKVCVLGLGWMGKVHLRIYSEMRGVDVVGVMDVDPKVLAEMHDRYGVATFTSIEELLAKEKPDAVSVCVPTVHHHEAAMTLIEHGIPMLIEKPLAASAAQGREIVAAAEAKGLPVMVGHIERFNPAVSRIKSILAEDQQVISVQIERVGPYPPRIQDVGVIHDLASHDIDLIAYLTGSRYKNIFAVHSSNLGPHEDSVLISAQMENDVLGQICCNWITPYKSRQIRVATKSRYIEANLITQQVKEYSKFETYEASYSVREWPLIFREPVREELNQFLSALTEGTPLPITAQDGLYVLETIERLTRCEC